MVNVKKEDVLKVIKNLQKEVDKDSADILQSITLKVLYKAKQLASKHNKTGLMERNITYKIDLNRLIGKVYIRDVGMLVNWKGKKINYANFVHFGTRPHIIKPKNKKFLRFFINNKPVFAKTVHHPGYKGDAFLYKALGYVKQKLKRS